MISTPVMSRQLSSELNSLSLSKTDGSAMNMHSSQRASAPKLTKFWEGDLSGLTQGKTFFICKLEGYRSVATSESLTADWPPALQIVRVMPRDWMHSMPIVRVNKACVGRTLIRTLGGRHCFLEKLLEMKLCAVIFLPSQFLVLSVFDKPKWGALGLLFPWDMIVRVPREYSVGPLNCDCDSNCDCDPCQYSCGCNCGFSTNMVNMSCSCNEINCSGSSRNCNVSNSSNDCDDCDDCGSDYVYPFLDFRLTIPEKNCDINNIENHNPFKKTRAATAVVASNMCFHNISSCASSTDI